MASSSGLILIAPRPPLPPPTIHEKEKEKDEMTMSYFAIRKGKNGLCRCIFLHWEDCASFLDTESEYSTFPTIEQANFYITTQPMMMVNTASPSNTTQQQQSSQQPSQEQQHETNPDDDESENQSIGPLNNFKLEKIQKTEDSIQSKEKPDPTTTNKRTNPSPSSVEPQSPRKKPKKLSWDHMYSRLKIFHHQHGHCDVPKQGHTEPLARWVQGQRRLYQNYKDDDDTNDTRGTAEQKIRQLKYLGFDFRYTPWQDYCHQAKQFLLHNGHLRIPKGHNDTLRRWLKRQMEELYSFESRKKSKTKLSTAQMDQLHSLRDLSNQMKDEEEFDEMFLKLKDYKQEHGHCMVPSTAVSIQDKRLHRWISKVRLSYRQLKETGQSQLTGSSIQKLTELGFVFVPKGKRPTWDERIEALNKFKEKYGHIRIPKSYCEDGIGMADWVSRQRRQRRLLLDGKYTALTVEKIQQLTDMGMLWEAGKRLPPQECKRTWIERYKELLDFKSKCGHTAVPQSTPGLGEWVRSQRGEYRKLQQKKKSSMTAERVVKLVEAGFLFDASRNRGKPSVTQQPFFQN